MPSTYSSSLRLELQATGENANTWGVKTNNNLNLIEQAVAGYVKITLVSASSTYTLDIADASASDGRNAFIEFVGTVASAISIVVPDVEKGYWVKNSATGSALTFRTSGGTGFTLPTNEWVFAITDGASAVNTTPTSLVGYAKLASTQVFTGANTFTSSVDITGPVSVSASAAFTRPVDIRSTLSVTGDVFVSGVTTLASSVDIKGATSLASTLLVNGNAVFNSNVSVSGTFTVSGVANLLSAVNLRGNTSVGGTLITTGNATFASNVSVSGSFTVSGASLFTSAVTFMAAVSSTQNAVFTSVRDNKGDLRTIVQNSQGGAYALLLADAGKHISITTGGVTVPAGVFAAGDAVSIYNNSGSNQTVTQDGGVTLRLAGTGTTGNRTLAQYGICTVLCVAANTFVISGAGLT